MVCCIIAETRGWLPSQILQDIDNGALPKHGKDLRLRMAVEFRLQSKTILCDTMEELLERSAQLVEEHQQSLVLESSRVM